jgi:hypothetical protein
MNTKKESRLEMLHGGYTEQKRHVGGTRGANGAMATTMLFAARFFEMTKLEIISNQLL